MKQGAAEQERVSIEHPNAAITNCPALTLYCGPNSWTKPFDKCVRGTPAAPFSTLELA